MRAPDSSTMVTSNGNSPKDHNTAPSTSSIATSTSPSALLTQFNRQHSQQEIEAARQLIEHSQSEPSAYPALSERSNEHGTEGDAMEDSLTAHVGDGAIAPHTRPASSHAPTASMVGNGDTVTPERSLSQRLEGGSATAPAATGQACRFDVPPSLPHVPSHR